MANFVVIYHDNCMDGFASAWVAHEWFDQFIKGPDHVNSTMEYIACSYGNPNYDHHDGLDIARRITGKEVLVFDFSFERDTMLRYKSFALSFEVFDHHKTAKAACENLAFCTFDLSKCGSMLAWERLFPSLPPPLFLRYVQDYDFWAFDLPNSRAINAAIGSYDKIFENYSVLNKQIQANVSSVITEGEAILRMEKNQVNVIVKEPILLDIGAYRVPAINCPGCIVNKAIESLTIGYPFAAGFSFQQDGFWKISLRSRGQVDVSVIAKKYMGGGHPGAASFRIGLDELKKMIVGCIGGDCKHPATQLDVNDNPVCPFHAKD